MLDAQYAEAQPESDAAAPEPAFFGVNRRRMDALLTDTQQLEQTASSAALRMMDDVYRQTLHKAELAMAAGATTLPKAIDMAVADFLRAGITCIEYKDGRRVNIADYAEMALRTAATRAKLQGDAALRAQLGVDTVLVSAYGQCSETCLPWQGRVYIDDVFGTFSGDRSGDRGHSVNGNWYPLLSVAVQHGLFHPNCRHTLSTWYEGISTMPKPLDAAVVRRNAKLEQQQRALERKLRQAKRLEAGCTDPENVKRYAQQRKDAQKALREFVNAHPDVLRRDAWKEKTYGIDAENILTEILANAKNRDIIVLTADMETVIAEKPFSQIQQLSGKLSDRAVRKWYLAQDGKIPDEIDKTQSIEAQARMACELRNRNRTWARDLMHDQEKRRQMDITDPNRSFEELIESKMQRKGLTRDEAVADVLNTATKTRKSVNIALGLEK